jgi:hypothetical protein
MNDKYKTVLIREELHSKLKEYSERSGIKMKVITETAIKYYLKHIKFGEEDGNN